MAEGIETVASDAGVDQRLVVVAEQRIFQPMAALRVPVQGHHVGEVIGGRGEPPVVPVDHADIAIGRVQRVPHVRVAVHDGQISARAMT